MINREIGSDICTLIGVKWITNKSLLYKRRNKIQKKKENKTAVSVSQVKEPWYGYHCGDYSL